MPDDVRNTAPQELQHAWDVTPDEAVEIQNRLRWHVSTEDDFGEVRLVAGVDIGFEDEGATTRAAVVTLNFPELTVYESALVRRPTQFPYIPGLLSFREVPAALDALAQLGTPPDLLLVDGQGYAHPRRLGIACHLGLLSNIPAIGVAKKRLVGRHDPLSDERGTWQPIHDSGEVIGVVLRTRPGVKPVYVSAGHRISLSSAIAYTLRCTGRYRLPETTRRAHNLASRKS
jgi:deoxyribonuclease V